MTVHDEAAIDIDRHNNTTLSMGSPSIKCEDRRFDRNVAPPAKQRGGNRSSLLLRLPSTGIHRLAITVLTLITASNTLSPPSATALTQPSLIRPTRSFSHQRIGRTSLSATTTTTTNLPLDSSWTYQDGNYLLPPPPTSPYHTEPRALLHFLGGAFVGAAPDLSYRYLLQRLSSEGFLVVATPYTLSFDYLATCDDVIARFERVAPALAERYGGVPVVGVGHSCGALLQLLITALFPDTPRAANALVSYNNQGVEGAVPFFEELVTPLFEVLADGNLTAPFFGENPPPSSVDLMGFVLRLARDAVEGNVPSDELLEEILQKTAPGIFNPLLPKDVRLPQSLRETIQSTIDPLVQTQVGSELQPIAHQTLNILEQIPSLITEVANGARDFTPPPSAIRTAARRAYRARRTLLLQYSTDTIDESESMEALLREAEESVMRNKRPMVDFDVKRVVVEGGHATPLLAPPMEVAELAEDWLGEEGGRGRLGYAGVEETVGELVRWLEEGDL